MVTLAISNGNTQTLNLSSLAGGTGTDSQTLTVSALSAGNTATIAISGGNTETLDLSSLAAGTGTDSQTLSISALSAGNTVTLAISGGNTETLDLSSLSASGLVSVTESGNSGYRLALADASRHGDIGDDAVDLSIQKIVTTISEGATGDSSFAGGEDTSATGDYSTAFGFVTHADSYGQTTIGHFNTASPGNLNAVVATDRLFVIGNGANLTSTSDALVMLKNGNTILNGELTLNPTGTSSYTLPTMKGGAGQVLTIDNATTGTTIWTTVSSGSAPTGLVSVTESGNTGYRLANAPENNHGDIGDDAIDFSIQDALSTTRGATGQYAFATGRRTTASGDYSTVFGRDNTASGENGVALGRENNSIGLYSTTIGRNNTASGTYSSAFGRGTTAESYGQTTLGIFSTP